MLRFSDITFSPISRPFSYNGVVFVTKEDGGTEVLFRRHDLGGAGLETSSRLFFRFAFNSELIIIKSNDQCRLKKFWLVFTQMFLKEESVTEKIENGHT